MVVLIVLSLVALRLIVRALPVCRWAGNCKTRRTDGAICASAGYLSPDAVRGPSAERIEYHTCMSRLGEEGGGDAESGCSEVRKKGD